MTRPRTRRQRTRALLGIAVLVTCAAAGAAYLYFHYVDVVRYSADQGRVTIERAELDEAGTVLVTNEEVRAVHLPTGCGRPCHLHRRLRVGLAATEAACRTDDPGQHRVRADLLGTMPDPGGDSVVTYHGWPLYTYLGDAIFRPRGRPGKDDDGGYWYVMRPSGQIVSP